MDEKIGYLVIGLTRIVQEGKSYKNLTEISDRRLEQMDRYPMFLDWRTQL